MKHLLFNDMINIEVFHLNLQRIDKKSYGNIDIYYIGYITIKRKFVIVNLQRKSFVSDNW